MDTLHTDDKIIQFKRNIRSLQVGMAEKIWPPYLMYYQAISRNGVPKLISVWLNIISYLNFSIHATSV